MQITMLHTASFSEVALLGMGRIATLHFIFVCCSTHVYLGPGTQCYTFSASAVLSNSRMWWLCDGDMTIIGRLRVYWKHELVPAQCFAGWYWLSFWPVSCWLSWGRQDSSPELQCPSHSLNFFPVSQVEYSGFFPWYINVSSHGKTPSRFSSIFSDGLKTCH